MTSFAVASALVSPSTVFRAVLTDSSAPVLFGSGISSVGVSQVMTGLEVSPSGWLSADELTWPAFAGSVVGMWVVREFDGTDPTLCFVPFVVVGDGVSDLVIEFNPGVLVEMLTVGADIFWVADGEPLVLSTTTRLAQFATVVPKPLQGVGETRVLVGVAPSTVVQGLNPEE